jgi:hypothetical protein
MTLPSFGQDGVGALTRDGFGFLTLALIHFVAVIGWTGHVVRTGEKCIQSLGRIREGKNRQKYLNVDGRIILRWTVKK